MKNFDFPTSHSSDYSKRPPPHSVGVTESHSQNYASILLNDFYGFGEAYEEDEFCDLGFFLKEKSSEKERFHCRGILHRQAVQHQNHLDVYSSTSGNRMNTNVCWFLGLLLLLTCSTLPPHAYAKQNHVFMIEKYRNYYPYRNMSVKSASAAQKASSQVSYSTAMTQLAVNEESSSSPPYPFPVSYGGYGKEKSYILENPISVYIIWYGNWSYKGASADMHILTNFLDSLSYELPPGTSNATVNKWWNAVRVYYNPKNGKRVSGNVTRIKEIFDNFSFGLNLSQPMVGDLIDSHIRKRRLPSDKNGLYIVFVSGEVCYRGTSWSRTSTPGPCSICLGCAFHGYLERTTAKNAYNLTYAYVANGFSGIAICGALCMPRYGGSAQSVNKNKGIDLMVNLLAHELAEASTDTRAYGEGWAHVEDRFWEIADICENSFMPEFFTDDWKSKFNLVGKGGMKFLVQKVFHLYRGCTIQAELNDTFSPPVYASPPPANQPPQSSPPPPRKYSLIPPPPRSSSVNPPPKTPPVSKKSSAPPPRPPSTNPPPKTPPASKKSSAPPPRPPSTNPPPKTPSASKKSSAPPPRPPSTNPPPKTPPASKKSSASPPPSAALPNQASSAINSANPNAAQTKSLAPPEGHMPPPIN